MVIIGGGTQHGPPSFVNAIAARKDNILIVAIKSCPLSLVVPAPVPVPVPVPAIGKLFFIVLVVAALVDFFGCLLLAGGVGLVSSDLVGIRGIIMGMTGAGPRPPPLPCCSFRTCQTAFAFLR